MTPATFNRYLKDPSQLDSQSVDELWMLVKEYPYFQVARMLLARNLYNTGHEAYPLSLRLAAAYAGDRSKLKALIEGKPVDISPIAKKEVVPDTFTETLIITNIDGAKAEDNDISAVTLVEKENNNGITQISPAQKTELPGIHSEGILVVNTIIADNAEISEPVPGIFNEPAAVNPEDFNEKAQGTVKVNRNPLIDSIYSRLSEMQITLTETEDPIALADDTVISSAENEQAVLRNELVDKFIREEPRIGPQARIL
jgi:hypothetical protein